MTEDSKAWIPAATCTGCVHRQLRGGIVFPRRLECVALEGERTKTASLMTLVIQGLARQGECPAKELLEAQEDGYLSEDLQPE
jgi:hypothetical protein